MDNGAARSVITNFLFLAFSQYGSMVVNIAFSLWLTRLLRPEDFGLVAILLFYFNFSNWVAEWGWEQGILAHKEIELNKAASTHLFVRAAAGALPLLGFGAVWLIRGGLDSTTVGVTVLLALAHWCEKIGFTYRTILEREYRLKAMAVYEFSASVLSYFCAATAALLGAGVLSLGVQKLVEKSIMFVGYLRHSPWKWGTAVDFGVVKIIFSSFGIANWIGSVFSLVIYDFMPFLIGFFSTKHQAGLYAKAFTMATFPLMLTAVCSRLVSPLYVQYQFNVPQLRAIFVKVQLFKILVLLPGQLLMSVTSSYWVPKLFGPAWIEMIPVYKVMTIYGLTRAFFDDVPPVLALGFKNPWALMRNQMVQAACVMVGAPLLVMQWYAFGGAVAMTSAMLFAAVLMWKRVMQQIECSTSTLKEEVIGTYVMGKMYLAGFKQKR